MQRKREWWLKTENTPALTTKNNLKMVLYAIYIYIFTNVYKTGGEGLKHRKIQTKYDSCCGKHPNCSSALNGVQKKRGKKTPNKITCFIKYSTCSLLI